MSRTRIRADVTLTPDEMAAFKRLHAKIGGRYFSHLLRTGIRFMIFLDRVKATEGARVEIAYPDGSRQRLEIIA